MFVELTQNGKIDILQVKHYVQNIFIEFYFLKVKTVLQL